MKVNRLSKTALQKILQGKVNEEVTCVVKFYSNDCHYCKELHEPYVKLADDYEDVHFFAFNIGDYPPVEKIVGFQGVPTLCLIKAGAAAPRRRVMSDPKEPDRKMWYHIEDIKDFIEKEK